MTQDPNLSETLAVTFEKRGAVALVTLNRPQALNSFTRQMHRDLWAALDRAEATALLQRPLPPTVINEERSDRGLPALTMNTVLAEAAGEVI